MNQSDCINFPAPMFFENTLFLLSYSERLTFIKYFWDRDYAKI